MDCSQAIRLCHRCDVRNRDLIIYSQPRCAKSAHGQGVPNDGHPALAAPAPTNEWNMSVTTDILIIEDDPVMRDALAEWLEDAGYRCERLPMDCRTRAVRLAAPALVVTDIYMPVQTGVVIRELKQGIRDSVIAISSRFDSGHGWTRMQRSRSAPARRWPSRSSVASCSAVAT